MRCVWNWEASTGDIANARPRQVILGGIWVFVTQQVFSGRACGIIVVMDGEYVV